MEAVGVSLFLLLWFVLFFGGFGVWIWGLVEVVRLPEHAFRMTGRDKSNWILVVVLAQTIGAIVWFFNSARREVKAAAVSMPYPTYGYGPPPGWYPDPRGTGEQAWWDGTRWNVPPPPSSPSA